MAAKKARADSVADSSSAAGKRERAYDLSDGHVDDSEEGGYMCGAYGDDVDDAKHVDDAKPFGKPCKKQRQHETVVVERGMEGTGAIRGPDRERSVALC